MFLKSSTAHLEVHHHVFNHEDFTHEDQFACHEGGTRPLKTAATASQTGGVVIERRGCFPGREGLMKDMSRYGKFSV